MSERGRGKCTVVLGVTAVETALISATRVDGQTALHVLNARRPSALVYTTAISRRRSLQYVCDERGLVTKSDAFRAARSDTGTAFVLFVVFRCLVAVVSPTV